MIKIKKKCSIFKLRQILSEIMFCHFLNFQKFTLVIYNSYILALLFYIECLNKYHRSFSIIGCLICLCAFSQQY